MESIFSLALFFLFRSSFSNSCNHLETIQGLFSTAPIYTHTHTHTRTRTVQSTVGQWVGCVAVDSGGDWMVCGGSMPPSIFRLASTNKISSLAVPAGVATQTAIFARDRVS